MTDHTTIPDGYKRCYSGKFCVHPQGPILPASTEYFHLHKPSPDGFKPRCKACRCEKERRARNGEPRALAPAPDLGHKRCTICQRDFPASRDYFHGARKYYDGLDTQCKGCRMGFEYDAAIGKFIKPTRKKRTPEEIKARKKAYNKSYRLKHLARLRAREREYKRNNPEAIREKNRKYYATTKGKMVMRAADQRRRRRTKEAEGSFTSADLELIYEAQRGLCWWCGKSVGNDFHIDHRVPLAKGGSNYPENLCVTCPRCNQSKKDKMSWEWCGRLL